MAGKKTKSHVHASRPVWSDEAKLEAQVMYYANQGKSGTWIGIQRYFKTKYGQAPSRATLCRWRDIWEADAKDKPRDIIEVEANEQYQGLQERKVEVMQHNVDVLERLGGMLVKVEAKMEQFDKDGKEQLFLSAAREIRETLTVLGKFMGVEPPQKNININASVGFEDLMAQLRGIKKDQEGRL